MDCQQSLFSSKTVGKAKNKRESVSVIVTALTLVAAARSITAPTSLAHSRFFRLHGFSRKRETVRSLSSMALHDLQR